MNIDERDLDRTPEELVERYSVRPGYQLLGYREVGLPYYYLRLRAVVMAHKPVTPIAEFVLKSLNLGLKEESEFGGFLGLESSAVRRTLVDLRLSEDIDLIAPPGSLLQEWSLTQKGRTTLQTAEQVLPEEISLPVYYDGLLRRVVTREQTDLQTAHQLRDQGCIQISPSPPKKPELDEITISEVNEAMRAMVRRHSGKRDLLVIKAVLGSNLYYQRAIMLLFQSQSGPEILVAFVVDGALSSEHEQAFMAKGGLRKLGISDATDLSANEVARRLLPSDLLKEVGDLSNAEALKRKVQSAQADILGATERLRAASTEIERHTVRERAETARVAAEAAQKELDKLTETIVETFEHRAILESAIADSKQRLLINSPWINARAVTHQLLRLLEKRLRGGLKVFIAYGLDPDDKPQRPADRDALNALHGLQRSYPSLFRLTRLGDTHAKVLISDSSLMVVTSFNWLSFRGDPNRTFRDERGIRVLNPKVINSMFDRIVQRMDEAESRPATPKRR